MRALARFAAWRRAWRPLLPIFLAEVALLIGFGAMLPVLPLYITAHDIDPMTLGLITAAWPAARLIGEPAFGWLADRQARKPLMVAGLFLAAACTLAMLWLTSPAAFFGLRFLTGLAGAMYDPAARSYLVDAAPRNRRGEAFAIYSAAQMSGLTVGPALGALGSAMTGGLAVPFVMAGAAAIASGIYLAWALPGVGAIRSTPGSAGAGVATSGAAAAAALGEVSQAYVERTALAGDIDSPGSKPPRRMRNRMLVATLVMNFGLHATVGVYSVAWSLFLQDLGATIGLIGLTYTLFALPVLVLGPTAGRWVDRGLLIPLAAIGASGVVVAMVAYGFASDPAIPAVFILVEGVGNALLGPALFAALATASPKARASTAQGLFGAAGTTAFIIASTATGWLYGLAPPLPFLVFACVAAVAFVIGLATLGGGSRLKGGHCWWRGPSRIDTGPSS